MSVMKSTLREVGCFSAAEGEEILGDESDEECDWTWITCAELSKCSFNLLLCFHRHFLFVSNQKKKKERSRWGFFTRSGSEKLYCNTSSWRGPAPSKEHSFRLKGLDFLNTSQWIICKICVWTAQVNQCLYSPAHLTLILHTCITAHHALPCVHVCTSHHIFRNPIIQRSSEQPSPLRCSLLQNANVANAGKKNATPSDLVTPLVSRADLLPLKEQNKSNKKFDRGGENREKLHIIKQYF